MIRCLERLGAKAREPLLLLRSMGGALGLSDTVDGGSVVVRAEGSVVGYRFGAGVD